MTKPVVRIEHDSIGPIEVPADVLWGAQTQRSLKNFAITEDTIPTEIIHALALIKQAAAIVNEHFGLLENSKKDQIVKAAKSIANGSFDNQFPLRVWQTGSGTQTNMNINEVISNIIAKETGEHLGSQKPLHPNDDVNKSQSTNDVFPSAIHIAAAISLKNRLLPELKLFIQAIDNKSKGWGEIIKVGRTHLQDAVPLTLGQEASAWRDQVIHAYSRIQQSLTELYPLPLGGTAVGTGLNTPAGFDIEITKTLKTITGLPFFPANNKFAVMANHDGLVNAMAQLKMLAITLLKIVNDIRLLSCGPRTGLGELSLPANEPGSSIMPGKINPTQCESMSMVCTQVMGLEAAVAMAGSGGHLQMNTYKPLIGFNLLHSINLLHDACKSCRIGMIEGMEANRSKINDYLQNSLMLVTALAPVIGYNKASEIAKYAHENNLSLRQASLKLNYISGDEFDRIIDPEKMTSPTP